MVCSMSGFQISSRQTVEGCFYTLDNEVVHDWGILGLLHRSSFDFISVMVSKWGLRWDSKCVEVLRFHLLNKTPIIHEILKGDLLQMVCPPSTYNWEAEAGLSISAIKLPIGGYWLLKTDQDSLHSFIQHDAVHHALKSASVSRQISHFWRYRYKGK